MYKPQNEYTVKYYSPSYEELDRGDTLFFETDVSNLYASVMGDVYKRQEGNPTPGASAIHRAEDLAHAGMHVPAMGVLPSFPAAGAGWRLVSGRGLPPQTTAACMAEGQRLKRSWPSASFWNTFLFFCKSKLFPVPRRLWPFPCICSISFIVLFDMGISSCLLPFTPVVVLPTSGVVSLQPSFIRCV